VSSGTTVIFFWTFSPSFGPALLYYQTDVLKSTQPFSGPAGGARLHRRGGAVIYAPLSRGVSRKRLIYVSISALAWERVAPLIPHVRDSAPRRAPYSSDLSPGIGPD
jgi:hypothetical protein